VFSGHELLRLEDNAFCSDSHHAVFHAQVFFQREVSLRWDGRASCHIGPALPTLEAPNSTAT